MGGPNYNTPESTDEKQEEKDPVEKQQEVGNPACGEAPTDVKQPEAEEAGA